MPNIRSVFLLDKASADAVRDATRTSKFRLDPTEIELGQYAGKFIVPADVMGDTRYSAQVKGLIGDAHLQVSLDHDELWPVDEALRKV